MKKIKQKVYVIGLCVALAANTVTPAFAMSTTGRNEQKEMKADYKMGEAEKGKASPSNASPSDAEERIGEVKKISLSSLEWKSAQVGWENPVKDGGLGGTKISLLDDENKKVIYEKGICAHAPSMLVYDISDKGFSRFQSYVGVNYDQGNEIAKGSCGFKVVVDGIELENIEKIYGSEPQQFVDVEIPVGAETLTLISTDGGDGKGNDHSVWADAGFLLDTAVQKDLAKVSLSSESPLIPVNGEAKLSVSANLVDGSAVDFAGDDIDVSYFSDDEEVAVVDESGLITGLADGKTRISCQVTKEEITKEGSLDIVVGIGDESTWIASSPDETQTVLFSINPDGVVEFTAFEDGIVVIGNSATGIKTSLGDFTGGLTFVDKEETLIEDSYELIGAKTSWVEAEATEMTLSFEKDSNEGVIYQIIVRVYNDGFAFRYAVDGAEEGTELRISEESTGFQLPKDSTSYTMNYHYAHEQPVDLKTNAQLTGTYDMPFLFESNGTWGLISEAHVTGEYCGASITGKGKGLIDVDFAPEQNGDVVTSVPFQSPWRFAVIGDLAAINENTMAENLSPECALEDTSWILPGVTSWTWLNKEGTNNLDVYKRYVDLSAEMGWAYLLLDDGWQPGNWVDGHRAFYPWTEELIDYAEEKGVGLLVWANHNDVNTEEELKALELWAEMGIKGIKVDFFESQAQSMIKEYDALQKKTAECKLLLNPHGANKTTGERRTWPQSLTREGVLGAEQHRQGGKRSLTAEYNCMVPFIRNAVGPADYTPVMSYQLVDEKAFTVSHMVANALVYESGIQCLSDRDFTYYESPAKNLLKNLPVSWDESHLIDGDPGEYVNIARRYAEDWYVGIICNTERDAELPLDFLNDDQTYYAAIYKDGSKITDIDVEMMEVTSETVLTIPLASKGGASIKILSEKPSQPETITLSESNVIMEQYQEAQIIATVAPEDTDWDQVTWRSSDESVAVVNNGTVTALKPGKVEITASTGFNHAINAVCNVTVQWPKYQINERDWTIKNGNFKMWKLNSEDSITITTEGGEYGDKVSTAKNVFFKDIQGDFSVSTKLDFEPGANYQSAGIILYANDKAVFEVLRRSHSGLGGRVFATVNISNSGLTEQKVMDEYVGSEIYLKLTRQGTSCTAFYSTDSKTWNPIGSAVVNSEFGDDNLKVGIYAVNGEGRGGEIPATFENFVYEKDGKATSIPFGIEVDGEFEELKIRLHELIKACDGYEEIDYTADSYNRLAEALGAAKAGLEKENSTKEEMGNYYESLSNAIDQLVLVDKELEKEKALLDRLIKACHQYKETDYTADSYNRLAAAIKAAKAGLANENAAKEEVNACYAALSKAIAELVKKEGSNNTENDSSNESSNSETVSDPVGTITNDPKKGKVNSITGIITGSGVGYSSWKFDEKGWTLVYADGTKAAGYFITDESGIHEIGQWEMINGAWYNFGADGYAKNGLIFDYVLGGYFYIDIASGMKIGWQQVEGKWYYFNPVSDGTKGKLAVNTSIQGYRVDEKGAWVE